MKPIHRNKIIALDKDNNIVCGPPPHPGYDPMPFAIAIQVIECQIIQSTKEEADSFDNLPENIKNIVQKSIKK